MNYYKIVDGQDNFIDIVNSFNFRYSHNGNIFSCFEDKAQYVVANKQIYRIGWLQKEDSSMKGKYPMARALIISKEEYDKYKAEMAKTESE
jgi:hypothetical protein